MLGDGSLVALPDINSNGDPLVTILKSKDIARIRDELLVAQDYKCGICSEDLLTEDNTNRHVDHNHDSGLVRGVLCRRCNLLEGILFYRFRRSGHVSLETDYIGWLEDHLSYLKSNQTDYEHPAHKNKKVTKFKNMKKEDQITILLEHNNIELSGKETKKELVKLYKKKI